MTFAKQPSLPLIHGAHELSISPVQLRVSSVSQSFRNCPRQSLQSSQQDYNKVGEDVLNSKAFDNKHKPVHMVETEHERNHPSIKSPYLRRALWQPIWLRKYTLYTFAGLFTTLNVALVILWRFVVMKHGLSLLLTRNEYAWTYGPTIVLVVVVSLWRQVDYHCKSLSPWQNLAAGPAPASTTVLLDYVSVLQISALVRAVRLNNFAVAITITGFAVLKLSLIFSTGLLVAVPTSFEDPASRVILETKFDALAFNALLPPSFQTQQPQLEAISPTTGDEIYTYFAISKGLDTLEGIHHDTTFQSFRSADDTRNMTKVTTIVDIFKPISRCEIGNATITKMISDYYPRNGHGGPNFYLRFDFPTCNMGYRSTSGEWMDNTTNIYVRNPAVTVCPPQESIPVIDWVSCLPESISGDADDSVLEWRWLILVTDARYNQTFAPNGTITNWSWGVAKVTAIVCHVDYEIIQLPVSYVSNINGRPEVQMPTLPDAATSGQKLEGMNSTQLNQAVARAFSGASTWFTNGALYNTIFGLMDLRAGGDGSYSKLMHAPTLQQTAELVFNGVSNVVAHNNLLFPDSTEARATVAYMEYRLHIRYLSLCSMVILFLIMTLFSLLLVVVRPYRVVSCNPNSLAASAAILGVSEPAFQTSLSYLGYSRESFMRCHLSGYMFQTKINNRFTLSAVNTRTSSDQSISNCEPRQKVGKWYPWAVRYPVFVPTMIVPIIAIVVLEILQKVSNAHQGITTVTNDGEMKENAFYYLTSLILLLIATFYNNLDFNIAIFAPLSALRADSLPTGRGIAFHLVSQMPIFALWRTVKTRHFGASLSNVAGLVGSTLTIVGSGLWVSDRGTLLSNSVSVQRLDMWNTTWNDPLNDSLAAVVYSMIQHQNLTYPPWTFDELAFPQVSHETLGYAPSHDALGSRNGGAVLRADGIDGTSSYELELPALRANLNCTFATPEEMTIIAVDQTNWVVVSLPLPSQCPAGLYRNETVMNVTVAYRDFIPEPGSTPYTATLWDLGQSWSGWGNYARYRPGFDYELVDPGCPSLVFALVYAEYGRISLDNVTAMICYQELQELKTSVTFTQKVVAGVAQPPAIDRRSPPIPDESSLLRLTNGSALAFSWQPGRQLSYGLQHRTNETHSFFKGIETFFDSIFNSSGVYDIESYMRPANAARFLSGINHAYRQYMTQVINANMRVPRNTSLSLVNNANSTTTFEARRTTLTPRMKVNRTTKFVLQAELATMVLCGAIAFFMVRIRGTMAHNPCTIAGTMSLVAGSEMVEQMPKGAETASEKELERMMSEGGGLYSLGWWRVEGNGERRETGETMRFGVDIGRAEPI